MSRYIGSSLKTLWKTKLNEILSKDVNLNDLDHVIEELREKSKELETEKINTDCHRLILKRKIILLDEKIHALSEKTKLSIDNNDEDSAKLLAHEILELKKTQEFYLESFNRFDKTFDYVSKTHQKIESKLNIIIHKKESIKIRDNIAKTEMDIVGFDSELMKSNDKDINEIIQIIEDEVQHKEFRVEATHTLKKELSMIDNMLKDEDVNGLIESIKKNGVANA